MGVQVEHTGYSSLSSPANSIGEGEQGSTSEEHGGLTDANGPSTDNDDMFDVGKLASPGADIGQYVGFIQRQIDGCFPLGPRSKNKDLVRDALAALEHDMAAGLGVLGLYGLDDANLGLAAGFLVDPVQRDEGCLLEVSGLADDETEGCREGYSIWEGVDEDDVVLAGVEFGCERGDDGYSGETSTDNDDVSLGGHLGDDVAVIDALLLSSVLSCCQLRSNRVSLLGFILTNCPYLVY